MDGERDFTIDPVNFAGLPEYVNKLKAEGTRFIIILVGFYLLCSCYKLNERKLEKKIFF